MALTLHIASPTMRIVLSTLFVASLLPACSTSDTPPDELEGESAADGEEGKGDSASAFTYFDLRADLRHCGLNGDPTCGSGYFVSRVNRSSTQCGRGVAEATCKVNDIDWSGTAMPAGVIQAYEDNVRIGTPMLVRGDLVPAPDDSGTTLAVTEIWIGSTTPLWYVDGVYTRVVDNGIRCIQAPCPNLTEQKLNSNVAPVDTTGLDFEPSLASQAEVEQAVGELYSPDGLIVVGYRYYDADDGKARTVNKFFTRAPVPLQGN